jgi:drug/metabolite transporter (DMT)-like permease
MLTAVFVAARVVANPVSNVLQKQLTQRSANPLFIIASTHALLALACLPLLLGAREWALPAVFWANMGVCALLAVSSNVLLVYALQATDLSVLGPINAYKSVISILLGAFLLGELPTPLGALGVVLIVWGSYFVVERSPNESRRSAIAEFLRDRGIQLRFAALALSATEAVFLKKALLLSSPLTTFVAWSVLGVPVAGVAILLALKDRVGEEMVLFRGDWGTYLWLAAATGLMQATTLFVFCEIQVGYSLALFQLSSLISVVLGYRYFQEGGIRRRLLGALIMACGAVLIVVHGAAK